MFIDTAKVIIRAGNGGDGAISFRHEKFVDHGGPDGGDGGKGGDVVFVASRNENTLANFCFQRELVAESGQPGSKQKRHGKNGADFVVKVPVGTVIINASTNEVIADFIVDDQKAIIAEGGNGGFGNAHFVSSVRQAPRLAEKGERGDHIEATLELKMIADVGLIGLPNAGKSTLLSVLSNARPEIANYPFTTLTPNLGVHDIDESTSLLFADIPGLIEGAAQGKGLGDEFLRHVERTSVLVHMIDAYQEDVSVAYRTIQHELKAYKIDLTSRPQIIALNKTEGLTKDEIKKLVDLLKKVTPKGTVVVSISAQARKGLADLIKHIQDAVNESRVVEKSENEVEKEDVPVLRLAPSREAWKIEKVEGGFIIRGKKIERFAARTDFSSDEGLQRLRTIMKKMGIMHELRRLGVTDKSRVTIANLGEVKIH